MIETIKLFILTLVVFLIIDVIWIVLVAKDAYQSHLGTLMGDVKALPSILFYLIYISGLLFFVIHPALEKESIVFAILAGGFLGLVSYGTYDLTSYATLKDWPLFITVTDIAWGVFLSASTSGIVYAIMTFLNGRG